MRAFLARVLASLVVLGLGACGSNSNSSATPVKTVAVVASQGALITVTAQDSPQLAGTQLSIPPGALPTDTTITLGFQTAAVVPTSGEAAGPVAVFGPSGTTFSTPATLTLPFALSGSQQAQDLYLYVLEDNGTSQTILPPRLQVDAQAGVSALQVTGFTRYQHGAHHHGTTPDGGPAEDAGSPTDGGSPTDAGATSDAGTTADAGAIADAGGSLDSGSGSDAGGPADAGNFVDAGATQLVFITAPQTLDAGDCSQATTVQFENDAGVPVVSSAQRFVGLGASGSVVPYGTPGCTQASQFIVVVPAGSANGSFYFKGNTPGPLTWTVSSTGLTSATQTDTVH